MKFHNLVEVSKVVQIGIRIENIKFSFVYYDPKTNINCVTILCDGWWRFIVAYVDEALLSIAKITLTPCLHSCLLHLQASYCH